jgi:hypothetical protein
VFQGCCNPSIRKHDAVQLRTPKDNKHSTEQEHNYFSKPFVAINGTSFTQPWLFSTKQQNISQMILKKLYMQDFLSNSRTYLFAVETLTN